MSMSIKPNSMAFQALERRWWDMCHRTESFWSSNWSFVVRLAARCLDSGWLVATTCLQVGEFLWIFDRCYPLPLGFDRFSHPLCDCHHMQVCHQWQGCWRAWAAATQAGLGKIGCFSSIGQEQCGCLMVFDGVWNAWWSTLSPLQKDMWINLQRQQLASLESEMVLPRFQHVHFQFLLRCQTFDLSGILEGGDDLESRMKSMVSADSLRWAWFCLEFGKVDLRVFLGLCLKVT